MHDTGVDPITFEVVHKALASIADEMALVVMRSSFSPVVRDTRDYSTALCDADGQVVAQSLTLPVQLGAFPDIMRIIREEHLDDLVSGDVLIANDPYGSGGQHLPDIYVIAPIFYQGHLRAYAATVAHHCDVGGITPGSMAIHATDIFQEGLQIPLVKLCEAGKESVSVMRILAKNSRSPRDLLGDIRAQEAACRIGMQGAVALMEKYGPTELQRYFEELQRYAEYLMREEIRLMPNGVYTFEDYIDGLGETPQPLKIAVQISVENDEIFVDFAGSAPQVKASINSPISIGHSATYCAIRCVVGVDMPNTEGYMRPIHVTAPLGTIVNPTHPAACGARGVVAYRVFDAIMGALAQVVPEKVIAAGEGGPTLFSIGGQHRGEPFVVTEVMVGNWGASSFGDGLEGVSNPAANLSNQPVELVEAQLPLRINRYGLVMDSGGPGKYRGGLAFVREFELLADSGEMTIRADRRDHPPYGLEGGMTGGPSANLLISPDGDERVLPTMPMESFNLTRHMAYRHISAGGGGFGIAVEREPARVLDDVLDGKVSRAAAASSYGVVLLEGEDAVDVDATKRLRETMSSSS